MIISSKSFFNTNRHTSLPLPLWLMIILVLAGGAIASFLLLEVLIWIVQAIIGNHLFVWEREFQSDLRTLHGEPLRSIMLFFTHLGSFYPTLFVVIGCSLILVRYGQYRETIMLLITMAGSWLINSGLKLYFMRPRPELEFWAPASGYSFPSGHATVAAAMYGMLFFIWARARKQQGKRMLPAVLCGLVLIILIGTTRIYLGVHYPTDVIAGFISGLFWFSACAYCLFLWQKYKPQLLQ